MATEAQDSAAASAAQYAQYATGMKLRLRILKLPDRVLCVITSSKLVIGALILSQNYKWYNNSPRRNGDLQAFIYFYLVFFTKSIRQN